MVLYSPHIWGAFLRAKRQERNWSMAEMSRVIGCTIMWISLQERGRLPHPEWVKKAALALGEDPHEWLRVYMEAVADAIQVDPDLIFQQEPPADNPLPRELRNLLRRILTDNRKYQKALRVLEVIAE